MPMSAPRHATKINLLASWGAHGVALVVGLFTMPYLMKVMGDAQYGTWVFINSFAGYSGLLYFGFGETISRYTAKHFAERDFQRMNAVVALVLIVYLCMGLVALAIAAGFCVAIPMMGEWPADQLWEIRLTTMILGLNIAIGLAGSVFGGVLMGIRRFDVERGVTICSDLLRVALIVVFLTERHSIITIAMIYMGITLFENVMFAWLAFRFCRELKPKVADLSWQTFRECSTFSTWAFVNGIAHHLTYMTDNVVIGVMLGPEAIVPYNVALRLTQFIRQPIDKISHVSMPTAGALHATTERGKLQQFLHKTLGLTVLLIGGMFIGAWFFGDRVIANWVGDKFLPSHRLLMILLGAQLIALPSNTLRAFLLGCGMIRMPALLYLTEAVLNLSLSITLCRFYGIEGVAWGTLIPLVILEIGVLFPYALRKLQVSWSQLLGRSILPQLPALAALLAYCFFANEYAATMTGWSPLLVITVGGGVVLAAAWLLSHSRQLLARDG